jgi:hypothetical protein
MSKRLFIDIETLPPPEDMRASLNPALVSKLENDRGSDAHIESGVTCTEEQFRRLPLHAEYGRKHQLLICQRVSANRINELRINSDNRFRLTTICHKTVRIKPLCQTIFSLIINKLGRSKVPFLTCQKRSWSICRHNRIPSQQLTDVEGAKK